MLSAISSLTASQAVRGKTENSSNQENSSTSAGWKYVTVTEGDIIYTYIVIGKNMKILIGKSATKEKDTDKKSGDDKNEATATSAKPTTDPQAAATRQAAEKVNFLNDYRMLGLTGYYQKKMRETLEIMESQLGCDQTATTAAVAQPLPKNDDE